MVKKFRYFLNNFRQKSSGLRFFYCALAFVVFAGVFLRAKLYLFNFSIWNDEASLAFNVVMKSYPKLFAALKFRQVCPPLFLVLTKFLLEISGQMNNVYTRDLVLRFLPAICGVLSVPFFAFVVHKVFKQRYITLLATVILAFNSAAISYSSEFKQYGVELFVTILLIYLFWNFKYSKSSISSILRHSCVFSLSPWLAYSALFLLPAGFLFILFEIFKKKDFNIKKLTAFFAPVSFSFFIFVFHYLRVHASEYSNMAYDWENLIPSFFNFDNFLTLFPVKTFALLPYINAKVLLLLLLAALAVFIKKNYKENFKILFLTLTPLILLILASFIHAYPYDLRLIIFILPVYGIILANLGFLFAKSPCFDVVFSLLALLLCIYNFFLPVKTFASCHNNLGREYLLIMKKENAKPENIVAFTRVGLWYLLPDSQNGKMNITAFNFPREIWPKKLELLFNKMPENETLWLYAPHTITFLDYDLVAEAKKYVETSPRFKILESLVNEGRGGFLIKFEKLF